MVTDLSDHTEGPRAGRPSASAGTPPGTCKMKKKQQQLRLGVAVFAAPPDTGLSSAQARERMEAGWSNAPVEPPSKTVSEIIISNVFTYFNCIFFILAACVIAVGSWLNLTFMGIIFFNTVIGIVQEIRAKRILDRLTLLSAPKATVIRDGAELSLDTSLTVRDDVAVFSAGNQIYADAEVLDGSVQVNEALVSGEADEITKNPGDKLLSGSFIVSGSCRARLTAVGADSFVSRLTTEAKRSKKPQSSEMMRSLTKLIKVIGFIVIPFGLILFIKEVHWLGRDLTSAVTSTVGAIIGMIPEGLYLLTSVALAAGTLRLARKGTLTHELECIETLARVDTLCVDKTGTITESEMNVERLITLSGGPSEEEASALMAEYVSALSGDNDTMQALRRHFTASSVRTAVSRLPFSSVRKYGGVSFSPEESYLLGAPDILAPDPEGECARIAGQYSALGYRVLLLAACGSLPADGLTESPRPLCLIVLSNKIRSDAPETFRYFAGHGVAVKVISGDNPATVSEVARRAGIPDADKYVDARTLVNDVAVRRAAESYTVFGRVSPEQKRRLIQALKSAGHTVAMTGDGVNDVLAMKAADCAVAMASGSDVACQTAHIVLMNSDFAAMPSVVEEGRRVINNIERSASLFLVKNIFSFILAFITLFFTLPYPFSPAQLSLVNALTIGIPSFVLALEPNKNLVSGRFLPNVLYRALPAALTDVLLIVGVLFFYSEFSIGDGALSSICTAVIGTVGLVMVHRTARPYNALRAVMTAGVSAAFAVIFIFFKQYFTLAPLARPEVMILIMFALMAKPFMDIISSGLDRLKAFIEKKRAGTARRPAKLP